MAKEDEVIDVGKVEEKETKDLVELVQTTVPQLFNDAQRNLVLNETPRYKIKRRQGKGGVYFDYVDVGYVIEQLNLLTGWRWNFQCKTSMTPEYLRACIEVKQFIVDGSITIRDKEGIEWIHEDTGRQDIKVKRDDGGYLDLGNDYKGAKSDCLKRCARQFGIALDVYSGAVKRRQDKTHPEAPITDGQRKRLEALAVEAQIGHSGLKKLINADYDYKTASEVQRRHFEEIIKKLEEKAQDVSLEAEMPEKLKEGFEFLKTPKAKRMALYKAHLKEETLDELQKKIDTAVQKKKDKEKK